MLLSAIRRIIETNSSYKIGINGFDNIYNIAVRDDSDIYDSKYKYTETSETHIVYNYISIICNNNYTETIETMNSITSILSNHIINIENRNYYIQKVREMSLDRLSPDDKCIYSILFKCIGKYDD